VIINDTAHRVFNLDTGETSCTGNAKEGGTSCYAAAVENTSVHAEATVDKPLPHGWTLALAYDSGVAGDTGGNQCLKQVVQQRLRHCADDDRSERYRQRDAPAAKRKPRCDLLGDRRQTRRGGRPRDLRRRLQRGPSRLRPVAATQPDEIAPRAPALRDQRWG
jgi:hypothetical protein